MTDTSAISRTPLVVRGLADQLRAHFRLPLHRDGYALALNSACTAATGLLYWMLAANRYSPRSVGINSALISSMMFLAGIACLNLPNILVRFLPYSGHHSRRHVTWSYLVAIGIAVGAAGVFIVEVGSWAPRLSFLRSDRSLQIWFVLSTPAWCVFMIQDSVLTALGRAIWVPAENAVFSVVKLGLLALLAASLPVYGIFVSWTIAMLVSVVGVNAIIFARLMRSGALAGEPRLNMHGREFVGYFAADYACSVAWLSATNLMPVVVTAVAGATTNAYYALAYAVVLPVYAFGQNIGTSLMLHGADHAESLRSLTRKAALQGLRVLIPCACLLVLVAPYLLSLFGHQYEVHSVTVLRLLALGTLPYFVLSLTLSVARIRRRLRRAVIALGLEAVLSLALAIPLLKVLGVNGAGVAWMAALVLVAAGLLLTWNRSLEDPERPTPPAPGNTPPTAKEPAHLSDQANVTPELQGATAMHPRLRELFGAWQRRGLRWTLLRVPATPAAPSGDVDVLAAPDDAAALREVSAELGFVAVPGRDSESALMMVGYDAGSGRWLLLDVSTTVSFRSPRSWRLHGAAEQVLARSRATGEIVLPSDGDAFWLLLLHCLLDKRSIPAHYRARLCALAPAARDSSLGPAVCSAAGAEVTTDTLLATVRTQEWELLTELGRELAAALKRRRALGDRVCALTTAFKERLRKPLLLRRRRGLSIALLGPNGVGKSTAAARLQQWFPFEARVVYMGLWKAAGNNRGPVHAALEVAVRPLRVWSRYLVAQYHQLRGRLVIFDRYVYEALLPPQPPLARLKQLYYWLLAHLIPQPAIVVVLDAPGEVAYARKQENPPDELERERRMYAAFAPRIPSLERIDAAAPATVVHARMSQLVWEALTQRWRPRSRW